MNDKILKRNEVNKEITWDLTRLYKTEKDYEKALTILTDKAQVFANKYKAQLNRDNLNTAIDEYRDLSVLLAHTSSYQSLHLSVEQSDSVNIQRSGQFMMLTSLITNKMAFFQAKVEKMADADLLQCSQESSANKRYLEEIIENKKHSLSSELTMALSNFGAVFRVLILTTTSLNLLI